jgi:endo-1,4-beta-xylanase
VRLQTYEPPQDTTKQDTTKTDTTKTDTTKTDTTKKDTTSNDSTIAIKTIAGLSSLSMHLSDRTLFIAGATAAKVDVFDMQGRPVFSAKNVKGSVELQGISRGLYMVRVRDGSKSLMQRVTIK